MAVALHYGVPGSYKTSGCINDNLPIAVKEGRLLITNIRGLDNTEKVKLLFKANRNKKYYLRFWKNKQEFKVHNNFEIMYLDTKLETNREKLRRFYHWAPQDSFFIIDEINTIYPKEWRASKLKEFDLHLGSEDDLKNPEFILKDRKGKIVYDVKTKEPVPRAQNLSEALEMHRHFNYDFFCTSPSYKKFNPVFHEVAEMAYKHVNRAIIGVKGSYWETAHTADNAGNSKQDQIYTDVKKVPNWVFKCYQSTATGDHRDTVAGTNIFLKAKVIMPIFAGILFIIYGFSQTAETFGIIKNERNKPEPTEPKITKNQIQILTGSKKAPKVFDADINLRDGNLRVQREPEDIVVVPPDTDYFKDFKIYLSGVLMGKKIITIEEKDRSRTLSASIITKLGYEIDYIDICYAKMKHLDSNTTRLLMCRGNEDKSQRVNFNPFK